MVVICTGAKRRMVMLLAMCVAVFAFVWVRTEEESAPPPRRVNPPNAALLLADAVGRRQTHRKGQQVSAARDADIAELLHDVEIPTKDSPSDDSVDPSNPLKDGQFKDENKVEGPLPPLEAAIQISLNRSSTRIFNDEATMQIPITIGVLTAPALLRSRLIPLLESSLRYEKDIHVFFMDDPKTLPGRAALKEYLHSVNRSNEVHIVSLPRLANMKMSLRNAWVNLPAVKYFRDARPEQRWFAIMDDDTYFLMNAIRNIIHDVVVNASMDRRPVYMGAPITDGLSGGCRVIRTGSNLRVQRTTTRKEVQFVCGGSGILLSREAIDALFVRNATGHFLIQQCMDTMFQGAGDVRLGHCLSEANVTIIPRREMFRDTMFRAIGEKRAYRRHKFPASFHRFRRREWQYALRAVEDAREPNELVTWGDLLQNFKPGPAYWHSMFFPEAYENYTSIMGLRKKTPHEIRRDKLICKKFQCCRKENHDMW